MENDIQIIKNLIFYFKKNKNPTDAEFYKLSNNITNVIKKTKKQHIKKLLEEYKTYLTDINITYIEELLKR